jgi:hypothetical protein
MKGLAGLRIGIWAGMRYGYGEKEMKEDEEKE